jgi:hypothetical protein
MEERALVLYDRVEIAAARSELKGNVDREARHHVAVGEPQTISEVARRATVIAHHIQIHCGTRCIAFSEQARGL